MNSPRRRDRDDDQERRQHVQGSRARHLRAGQLRRQQRARRATSRRAATPVRRNGVGRRSSATTRTCCSGKGTPISAVRSRRDKVWFYARLQPLQDRQAGVRRRRRAVATDLGIFDNYTAKGDRKISQNNTLIGYIQCGRKQKPFRNLSTLVPAESILAQDSWSKMCKGEWQSVLSDRAFLNVNVGRFTLDWPMVPAVDPARALRRTSRRSVRRSRRPARAGTRSRPSDRSRRSRRRLTYYLPGKGGSHDFKFGFEDIDDSYQLRHQRAVRPVPPLVMPTTSAPRRIASASSTPAMPSGTTTTAGSVGPTSISTTRVYAQDRWAPNNRLIGDRRPPLRLSGRRATTTASASPEISDSTTGAAGRRRRPHLPASSTVAGASFFKNKNVAGRVRHQLRPHRRWQDAC